MKRVYLFLVLLLLSGMAIGQPLTGTKTIPGDYATVQAAITDLNSKGVGTGGVTFNVAAGHTETVTAQLLITATGTSANPIVFQKSGSGANPLITRTDAGSNATGTIGGLGDAIIRLDGSDYITFDGISLSASQSTIEYGYFTFKPSATNGCQYVTIKNSVVTMTKGTSGYVLGIYISNGPTSVSSSTGVTVTAASGTNSNIVITGNTVQNVHAGIYVRGSSATGYYDNNVTIGQSGAGNTIQNFGGGSASTTYGVYFIYVTNCAADYNTIANAAGGGTTHGSTFYGIFYSTVSGVVSGSNNALTMSCSGTSAVNCIYNANTCTSETYNNNSFASGTLSTTGTVYLIYASNATNNKTISNNTISGTFTRTAASGSVYCYYNSGGPTGGTETISGNNFSNFSLAGTSAFYGIYSNTTTSQNRSCYDNTVSNCSGGTGLAYGFYLLSGLTNQIYNNTANTITAGGTIYGLYFTGTTPTVYNNIIHSLTTSGSTLYGIYNAGTGTTNLFRNRIYNLTSNGTNPSLYGLYITTGTANYNYNNFISDLKTPSANAGIPLAGIYVSGGTSIYLYDNTVYLNATSSGALFGSAAIYNSSTPTVDMRNNIAVNVSVPNGTGLTAAYRRSTTTLTSYSSNSNYNCFYAGDPGASNVIFYDGTNSDQTFSAYKGRVSPRDGASFSELPPFVDVSATPYDLHIATGTPTQCESGGVTISTPAITTDYDLHFRYPNAGYPDDPGFPATAPDVGADEFAGVPQDLTPPNIVYSALPNTALFVDRTLTATITDASGVPTSGSGLPMLYWQVNGGGYNGVQGVSIGSNQYTFTFGSGVTTGDIITYYVVAQDMSPSQNVGAYPSAGAADFSIDPPACNTPPTTPSSYTVVTGISGAFTVGTGGDYPSLTGAGGLFADINSKVVVGNITVSVISDLTEDGANALNQTSEDGVGGYTITIQPDGTTPRIISGTYTGGLIRLNGADRVVFDGSYSGSGNYLTFQNSSTTANSAVFQLISLGTGQGATYNTIKNTNIVGGSITLTSFFDIFMGSASISTSGTGADNDNNTIENNVLTKAYYGIYARGVASTGLLNGLVIRNNTIGSATATDYITFKGVEIYNATAPLVTLNHIFNLQVSAGVNNVAIDLGDNVTDAMISKNQIHGMRSTSTSGYGCYGINIASASTSGIQIINNMIYDLINDGDGTSTTYNPFGIRITGGTNHKIYNNSVNLYGSFINATTADISAALLITVNTVTGLDIRNNIFVNTMTGGAGSKCYAIYAVTGTTFGTINYNDYYVSGGNGVLGYLGSDKTTFNDWKTATAQDASSFSYAPEFTSNTDLHINSGLTATRLESGGVIIASFNEDIDGNTRPGPTGSIHGGAFSYDLGADEFDGVPAPSMLYSSSTVTQNNTTYVFQNSTNNQVIGIEIVTTGIINPLEVTEFTVNTTGTTNPAADIANAKIFYTGNSSTFAATGQFGSTVASPSGSFAITGSQLLSTGTNYFWLTYDVTSGATATNVIDGECTNIKVATIDRTPTQTAPAGGREILGPLNGTYTVGTSGNFINLENAFAAANSLGLAGNVTFNIISDLTETSTAALNQWTEFPSGSNYTLAVQPSGGATRTISGNVSTALIKLNGADRVTINGLNTGGNALVISNTSTSTSTTVIWLASLGAGSGATNNTIKNCTISGGSFSVSSFFDIFMAGSSVSTSGTGEDNNNNTIEGNVLKNSYYGIYVRGVASTGETAGLVIRNNTIGSTGSDIIGAYGISLQSANGATIIGNDIFGINANNSRYGIWVGTNVSNSIISKNKIHGLTQSGTTSSYYCIGIYFSSSTSIVNNEISNNAIYDLYNYGSTTNYYGPVGIRLVGGDGHKIYFNTVNLTGAFGSSTAGVYSHCLMVSTAATNMDCRNNVFSNKMTGNAPKTYTVYNTVNTGFTTINFNDYYSASATYFGYFAADIADFSAWQTATGQDANSLNEDPMFVSNASFVPQNSALVQVGEDIASIPDDINGDLRNSPPDMGAVNLPSCTGAVGGTAVVTGNSTFCASGTPVITASGYSSGIGSGFQWQYSNDNFVADINDFTGQTNPSVLTTGVVSSTTYYRLKVTCTSGLGTDYSNVITITINPNPPVAVNPTSGSYCVTGNVAITASGANTYSWAPAAGLDVTTGPDVNASPSSTTTYTVIGTNTTTTCTASTSITISVNPNPNAVTVSPATQTICNGSVLQLTGSGGQIPASGVIGTGSTTNTTTTPYKGYWGGTKAQYLYTAAELTALGMVAGSNISSVMFNITAFTSPYTFNDFTIGLKNTTSTSMSTTIETGVSTVFGPQTFSLSGTAPFTQSHTLASQFSWDGTSNLLVEFCFNNNNGGGVTGNSANVTSTSVTGMACYYSLDNSATVCSSPGAATVSALRPNITFGYTLPTTFSWTPLTDLFTDAGATIPYTGTNLSSVYAKPSGNQTYTLTASSLSGCTSSNTSTLTVDQPSAGGTVSPASATITGGQSTGNMDVAGYTGAIVKWQRNFNLMGWTDIPSTAGLTTYSEIPSSAGQWQYRAVVQNGVCATANSSVCTITVNTLGYTTFSGAVDNDWNTAGNWDNGVPTVYYSAYIPANKLVEVNTTSCKCYNLLIEPLGMMTVNNGADLQVLGTMTVQASATGMGSVIDNGTLTTGSNVIQRWVSTNGTSRWEYVSSPVSAASSSLFTSSTRSLWYANEPTNSWMSITHASPATMSVMKGYARKYVQSEGDGNTQVNFSGTLNTGAKSIALTRTNGAPGLAHGWNLVGNPYPSTMDWNAASGWTKTNVDDAIYFRSNGNFASYVAGVGTNGGTRYIPPMQAFWVRVTSGQSSGTLGSNNQVRVHNAHNTYKVLPASDNTLSLTVTNTANLLDDQTVVRFGSYASNDFDGLFDAYKMFAADSVYPQVYTQVSGEDISINSLADLQGEVIIPLGFQTKLSGQFTMNADNVSSFTNLGNSVYLEDLVAGASQNLAQNSIYQFSSGISSGFNRFILHFNPNMTGISENGQNDIRIFGYENNAYICSSDYLDGTVEVFDMLGQLVASKKVEGVKTEILMLNVKPAVYIVKYTGSSKSATNRVFIK